jgi:hypothetical protein
MYTQNIFLKMKIGLVRVKFVFEKGILDLENEKEALIIGLDQIMIYICISYGTKLESH